LRATGSRAKGSCSCRLNWCRAPAKGLQVVNASNRPLLR
jgi:hypothetical protein